MQAWLADPVRRRVTAMAGVLAAVVPLVRLRAATDPAPARPVRLIVPFPPGSTPDALARLLAPGLQQALGPAFVVENASGANGTLGLDRVAKAAPDGLTLGLGTNGPLAINPALYAKMPYAPARDLTPIALLVSAPQVLVVRRGFPADDLERFLSVVAAAPGRFAYASLGSGSASHLTMEMIKQRRRLAITHVPYRGSPQALADLLGGQVDTMVSAVPAVAPHVRTGALKALAVTSAHRAAGLPQLPTLADAGLPGLEASTWIGLVGPAGLPADRVEQLAAQAIALVQRGELRARLQAQGFEITPQPPQAFAQFLGHEAAKWAEAVRLSGATVD